jgi:hypothetical protein
MMTVLENRDMNIATSLLVFIKLTGGFIALAFVTTCKWKMSIAYRVYQSAIYKGSRGQGIDKQTWSISNRHFMGKFCSEEIRFY